MSTQDFSTLLVANRGEIALRIMRTARRLGMRTIAVYSDADATAPHVKFADDAVRIGPAQASESYLKGANIIEAARISGAQAVHPGYGFLSENASFARDCREAGLNFVGPPEHAIRIMGDKARAKRAMTRNGVPCIPGYDGEDQSDLRFFEACDVIGFPVMVKASAGGGGRGMRLVQSRGELANALSIARSEAKNAFGSDDLILEKAILRPRHVEIQIFADAHGTVIHLGERDCSVQRRHQKVIEEAPCPVMTSELRKKMGAAAVKAAQAVDYCGAGTVEFLLDDAGNFYFLEMNTRLQVEHAVTEQIVGIDLVEMQLLAARGEALPLDQADLTLNGHAIEVRLYAEDPENGFLPSNGAVLLWHPPNGEGVRVDAGIETGSEVSSFYDPMIAKIIGHGSTREEARRRLVKALKETYLFGPKNNRDFLIDALCQPAFVEGEATTAFIGENYGEDKISMEVPSDLDCMVAASIQHGIAQRRAIVSALHINEELLDWSSTSDLNSVFEYNVGDGNEVFRVMSNGRGRYSVTGPRGAAAVEILELGESVVRLKINDRIMAGRFFEVGNHTIYLALGARSLKLINLSTLSSRSETVVQDGVIVAPMHGRLLAISVSEGEHVKKDDALVVLEAMKMQHLILAPMDGVVSKVVAEAAAQIGAGDIIMQLESMKGPTP